MTPEGYKKIETEIAELKKDRPRRIKILQEARSLGDLSENSEYTEAKRDLGHLQSRLRFLNKQLQYAQIVQKNNDGVIDLGSQVEIQFEDEVEIEPYTIVGTLEADVIDNKISFDSPLGAALMNKKAGDLVKVNAPAGSYQVRIISVK